MPVVLDADESNGLFVRATYDVTFAECAMVLDELLDDARTYHDAAVLVDATGVRSAPSSAQLRLLARDLKPLRDRGVQRLAIYTDSMFVYGIARMFGVFAEMVDLKVGAFRGRGEAEEWLASFGKAA